MRIDLSKLSWRVFSEWVDKGKVRSIPDDTYDRVQADVSFPFWDLTIRELVEVLDGNTPKRLAEWLDVELDAYRYIARLKGWKQWLEAFTDIMKSVGKAGKQTSLENYVERGLPEMKAEESMLTFTRRYFYLNSFEEAEQVTLGDYYLARKDDYVKRLGERRARDWQEREMKKKRNKGKRNGA